MSVEGCIVVTAPVAERIKDDLNDPRPRAKKARHESFANNVVCVDELRREVLEVALRAWAGEGASVAVTEDPCNQTGIANVFTLRVTAAATAAPVYLPKRIVVGNVSIRVLSVRQTSAESRAPQADVPEFLTRPVLLVGAGGIGCELLKVLVLSGFRHIEMIDLDTIDATNLNRQFLFTSADVGMPKAVTARAAVLRWFEQRSKRFPQLAEGVLAAAPTIVAYHDNVKDESKFGEAFYGRFAAVLNALDNVSARQHVNRVCMKVNVPLFESGTMGYSGQVQPILKGVFECYDCRPKPADQKTFAVCTIHARPTTMVHCVHFAKELYETLFGERSILATACGTDEVEAKDGAHAPATAQSSAGELAYLHDVVHAWRVAASSDAAALLAPRSLMAFGKELATCLFHDKIAQLLSMKSVWSTEPPVALDVRALEAIAAREAADEVTERARHISRDSTPSVDDDVRLFLASAAECCRRVVAAAASGGAATGAVAFKKEDDVAVDFVAATANLRAHAFHIAEASVEELRTIAGAIVPAIATTNAMVAAGVVQQLLRFSDSCGSGAAAGTGGDGMGQGSPDCQMVYVRKAPLVKRRLIHASPLLFDGAPAGAGERARQRGAAVSDHFLMYSVVPGLPNLECPVCVHQGPPTVQALVSRLAAHTLSEFVKQVLVGQLGMECPSVVVAARIVYEEEDYEDLVNEPLSSFALGGGEDSGAAAREVSFLVDALNKDVEWRVIVREEPGRQHREDDKREEGDAAFVVGNLSEALLVEAASLAAREAKKAKAAEQEGATERERREKAEAEQAHDGTGGATADCAIDLDDDHDGGKGAGATIANADTDDDVIEID